ncbi:hypothetical protein FHS61_001751 [Altererythrobacter atlanticus]|uniref:Uncharacterized protein n=1 Tax=Croceibacterium atlanticum TaxID=1267766 RepID=A0A0F7KNT3_9SPHN|nr:hypothetical protein [Croceibacterium atlanticum]AKH41224.1 hypothetical protein WYH_00158 [Croceibacterium atlanticum]MBB5732742.1 hypothetical protein [Croceibacterium atlanticum]
MRRAAFLILLLGVASPAAAREVVDASPPEDLAVTLYRDPDRAEWQDMDRDWPQGFAMITETRRVTLPPGRSTIRFTGVAEGMVAVSAIVTGLPGGTIEKNRNADLLSPAALVDGTLGNRVRITRTDPATGMQESEQAIVRTRADGGLVLQTAEGYEAVRCSGLPEKLTFDRVPDGLSAQPVFTIDTRDETGGTYDVQLTYLAWGFDWQAHYVGTLAEGGDRDDVRMHLRSWLTVLNDNGQSFPDAELLVVAGRINVESDFEELSDPPMAQPLRLTCYPFGSTAAGTPFAPPPPAPPPPARMMAEAQSIVVTGGRVSRDELQSSPVAMMAGEEQLGDLKLYRVPERVTVAAQGLKQVAFLDRKEVKGRMLYEAHCTPWHETDEAAPAEMLFSTVNDEKHGLGMALPMGGITLFEPGSAGDMMVGEQRIRDYAEGQDVEISLGASSQVTAHCLRSGADGEDGNGTIRKLPMQLRLTNANPFPVTFRIQLGSPNEWQIKGLRRMEVKNSQRKVDLRLPPNSIRDVGWRVSSTELD